MWQRVVLFERREGLCVILQRSCEGLNESSQYQWLMWTRPKYDRRGNQSTIRLMIKHELASLRIVSNDTKWRTLSTAHVGQKKIKKSHDMIPVPSYPDLGFFFHESVDLRSSGLVTGMSSYRMS